MQQSSQYLIKEHKKQDIHWKTIAAILMNYQTKPENVIN